MSTKIVLAWLVTVLCCVVQCQEEVPHPIGSANRNPEEEKAAEFLVLNEEVLRNITELHTFVEWDFESNINDETEKRKIDFQEKVDAFMSQIGNEAKKFDLEKIYDRDLKRKLRWIRDIGTSILSPEKLKKFHDSSNAMNKIYSTAKIPAYGNSKKLLSLEPDLSEIFATSRDPKELEYYWNEWRHQTGDKMRDHFLVVLDLVNEAARLNGYKDGTAMKVQPYESETFVEEMAETWEGLKPLYEQLHAYVRSKLQMKYGYSEIDPMGPIPAHLLGNMWAQSWSNLADFLRPYPHKPSIDVTPAMKDQGWTPKIMFQKADEFFISLGLDPMPEEFWKGSIIEKPTDGRDLVCHASAWDFYNGKDFRIKQCTSVRAEDFITVNHEMGHIQYQRSYRNLSFLFRDGANPGFHEGVADILSLAVGTASYYKRLGLIGDHVDIHDKETDINILFENALQRLAFMPFGYLIDKYRWDLLSGHVSKDDLNCHWVKLRSDIQGVAPPNQRTESMLDAGAKYHVAANSDYVQYFTAHIYEYQFYKALCEVSGQYEQGNPEKPLHQCNFYGSKEAGKKLLEMLSLGKSKPWKEIMGIMTGTPKMDTSAFREYFSPLEEWLVKYNKDQNNQVGWIVKDFEKLCSSKSTSSASSISFSTTILLIIVSLNFLCKNHRF